MSSNKKPAAKKASAKKTAAKKAASKKAPAKKAAVKKAAVKNSAASLAAEVAEIAKTIPASTLVVYANDIKKDSLRQRVLSWFKG